MPVTYIRNPANSTRTQYPRRCSEQADSPWRPSDSAHLVAESGPEPKRLPNDEDHDGSDPEEPDQVEIERVHDLAAEAADDVVEDGQAPAQGVDADALVDPMEALEKALVRVEPER